MSDSRRFTIASFDLLLLVALWYKTQNIWTFLLILFLLVFSQAILYFIMLVIDERREQKREMMRNDNSRINRILKSEELKKALEEYYGKQSTDDKS